MLLLSSPRLRRLGFVFFFLITGIYLAGQPPEAKADDTAGLVIAAKRAAWADRSHQQSILSSKSPVYTGDLLATNEAGRLQVLFRDDSVLMLAPSSETKITEYFYSADRGQGSFNLELTKGVTRLISGRLVEHGTIEVITPEAQIGIRGTDIYIERDADSTRVIKRQGAADRPTVVAVPGREALLLRQGQGVVIARGQGGLPELNMLSPPCRWARP